MKKSWNSYDFRKILLSFLAVFCLAAWPVQAHGGFEKVTGDTIIYISQTPLSPKVGENVEFSFNVVEGATNRKKLPIHLTLVDTFHGDETKDNVILEKDLLTDANGTATFTYTFTKENYFDIDLAFKDLRGKDQETGFLVQARDGNLLTQVLKTLLSFILSHLQS